MAHSFNNDLSRRLKPKHKQSDSESLFISTIMIFDISLDLWLLQRSEESNFFVSTIPVFKVESSEISSDRVYINGFKPVSKYTPMSGILII